MKAETKRSFCDVCDVSVIFTRSVNHIKPVMFVVIHYGSVYAICDALRTGIRH